MGSVPVLICSPKKPPFESAASALDTAAHTTGDAAAKCHDAACRSQRTGSLGALTQLTQFPASPAVWGALHFVVLAGQRISSRLDAAIIARYRPDQRDVLSGSSPGLVSAPSQADIREIPRSGSAAAPELG